MSGKSMLEMLAVLTIVGVLSVSAWVGFTFAMNKYKANATVYDVSFMAATIMTNGDFERTPMEQAIEMTELSMTHASPGYPLSPFRIDADIFRITADDVPKSVCRHILNGPNPSDFWMDVNDISSNGMGPDSCTNQTNSITFYFDAHRSNNRCGAVICGPSFMCDTQTQTCVCPPGHQEVNGVCTCAAGLESCNGGCYTPCREENMTSLRNENCTCLCDTALGFNATAIDGTCTCPDGTRLIDGYCQSFGCSGGTKGASNWTCQINGHRCGYSCTEDGATCSYGFCTNQCLSDSRFEPLSTFYKDLWGCRRTDKPNLACYKMGTFIQCELNGLICGTNCNTSARSCNYGDCEDKCTPLGLDYRYQAKESTTSGFYGCYNAENNMFCRIIYSTGWVCSQDGIQCASGCKPDGTNCPINTCSACPEGTTLVTKKGANACQRADGVYCTPESGYRYACYIPDGTLCATSVNADAQTSQTGTCNAQDCPSGMTWNPKYKSGYGYCVDASTGIACLKKSVSVYDCYQNKVLCASGCKDYHATGCTSGSCQEVVSCPTGMTQVTTGGEVRCKDASIGLECDTVTKNCQLNGLLCGKKCTLDGKGCTPGVCRAEECPSGQEPRYANVFDLFTCQPIDSTIACSSGACTIGGNACGRGCSSDGMSCDIGACSADTAGCPDTMVFGRVSNEFYGCIHKTTNVKCHKNGTTYTCYKNASKCGVGCTIDGTGGSCDAGCGG